MKKFLKKLNLFYKEPKIARLMKMVPRVRVVDNEVNRANNHWKALIGQEGIFLGSRTDAEGEIWDIKLDSSPIPHTMVNRERFELLPPKGV